MKQMEDKRSIRRRMRELNRSLPPERREEAGRRIMQSIEASEAFARARTVALFSALPDEPPTAEMIRRWSATKRIVLPRVEEDTMRFYPFDPATLCQGAFGILEPAEGAPCATSEIDWIAVPGVAFTSSGERLGRGRGYYDKYLSQPGFRARKTGICYAHQIVDALPSEPHDVRMDDVVAG